MNKMAESQQILTLSNSTMVLYSNQVRQSCTVYASLIIQLFNCVFVYYFLLLFVDISVYFLIGMEHCPPVLFPTIIHVSYIKLKCFCNNYCTVNSVIHLTFVSLLATKKNNCCIVIIHKVNFAYITQLIPHAFC